eukprot:gene10898-14628_t
MDIDIISLILSRDGMDHLLFDCNSFGISFNRAIINLGQNTFEKIKRNGNCLVDLLEDDDDYVPLGYEELNEKSKKSLIEVVDLSCNIPFSLDSIMQKDAVHSIKTVIEHYDVYPSNKNREISRPKCDVYIYDRNNSRDNEIQSTINPLPNNFEIVNKSIVSLAVKLSIESDYIGPLDRLIVFRIASYEKISPISTRKTIYYCAIQIVGAIVTEVFNKSSDSTDNQDIDVDDYDENKSNSQTIPNNLSVDAKPFIPIASINYFNHQAKLFAHSKSWNAKQFQLPKNFRLFIHSYYSNGEVKHMSQRHIDSYHYHYNNNNLPELISAHGMNEFVSDQIADDVPMPQENSQIQHDKNNRHLENIGNLMIFEEIHMGLDICQYDLTYCQIEFPLPDPSISINNFNSILTLKPQTITIPIHVKGSSENRPQIMIGDIVKLRPVSEDLYSVYSPGLLMEMFEIQGIIKSFRIKGEIAEVELPYTIELKQIFNKYKRFHVRFTFDKFGFVFVHKSLAILMNSAYYMNCLFPSQQTIDLADRFYDVLSSNSTHSMEKLDTNQVINPRNRIGFNDAQNEAIDTILQLCEMREMSPLSFLPLPPYVIFGPPGTGKTSTIIETILAIREKYPNKRILACAPSDAAADVICLRLISHFQPNQLFRLNWWQRISASLPIKLLPYSNKNEFDMFDIPQYYDLNNYQVIVSTCGTSGIFLGKEDPYSMYKKIEFDVVIVDEASQTTEAEINVPLVLCKPGGLMVLSGDTKQLGPNMRSPLFAMANQTKSLQERLLTLPYYASCLPWNQTNHQTTKINNNNQMKQNKSLSMGIFLTKNYRSHKVILTIPSKSFYGNSLEECGDQQVVNSLTKWEWLPQHKPFPLLFIGVNGKHAHEMDSPSFYNTKEVNKVVETCQSLLTSSTVKVKVSDIGVIAAFRNQVLRIRLALRAVNLHGVNVGSVEDFQGQEVKVVIISTVLSHWVEQYEVKGALGLVGDNRRFNVAVTRGMSLCVVIGHPFLLYRDNNWKQLMEYCIKN